MRVVGQSTKWVRMSMDVKANDGFRNIVGLHFRRTE